MKIIQNRFFILILAIALPLSFFFFIPKYQPQQTQDETVYRGTVEAVTEVRNTQFEQRPYIQQVLLVTLHKSNDPISVSSEYLPKQSQNLYEPGDKILIGYIPTTSSEQTSYVIGYDRTNILGFLAITFVVLAIFITRLQGVKALLSMFFSFCVIIFFLLPLILQNFNPLLISIIGIFFIIPISFSLTHGINKKTISAVVGTLISLTVTGLLASFVIHASNISGITSEDVEVLFYSTGQSISLGGILLAGILIGTLGILDDVAVSQASIVLQLKKAAPSLSSRELFSQAMAVGRDHISSVINTLVLVYTGGSLSTLLLFLIYPRPLIVLLNSEIVVIQIVIALVGSIGLILAIPTTTFITVHVENILKKKLPML